MAKFSLIPFDIKNSPPIKIATEINQTEEAIFISYKITGQLSIIDLGDGTPIHQRKLKLWEKTCFELFLKNQFHEDYIEFNFSPLFEWNSFYFAQKGSSLSELNTLNHMNIDILRSSEVFQLIVNISTNDLPKHFQKKFSEGKMSAGISTVIRNKDESTSYWALDHKDQKPNFHHFESFKCKF